MPAQFAWFECQLLCTGLVAVPRRLMQLFNCSHRLPLPLLPCAGTCGCCEPGWRPAGGLGGVSWHQRGCNRRPVRSLPHHPTHVPLAHCCLPLCSMLPATFDPLWLAGGTRSSSLTRRSTPRTRRRCGGGALGSVFGCSSAFASRAAQPGAPLSTLPPSPSLTRTPPTHHPSPHPSLCSSSPTLRRPLPSCWSWACPSPRAPSPCEPARRQPAGSQREAAGACHPRAKRIDGGLRPHPKPSLPGQQRMPQLCRVSTLLCPKCDQQPAKQRSALRGSTTAACKPL